MMEHYGGQEFIYDLVHEQGNGIEGYNTVIPAYLPLGVDKDFDAIFQDWTIANYLDDTSLAANEIYGYSGLDIPSADTQGWSIPLSMAYYDREYRKYFNTLPQLEGTLRVGWPYPYGQTLPYTANYVEFLQLGDHALYVAFNGADTAGVAPHSPTHEWHSDGTAWSWFRLGQTFAIPATGATLKFWSNYGIEENWDYGYVEVHDLTTNEWYTLPGLSGKTVSTIPNPQDNPNCDLEFEPTTYKTAGRWNAFTGSSGWYQEQMSLADFADHSIELYFTYWTDPYTLEKGWYIDDIEITGGVFPLDNVESDEGNWITNTPPDEGWQITTGVYEMDFSVNFVQLIPTGTMVTHLPLVEPTETGSALFPMINNAKVKYGPVMMIIAAQPGYELAFSTTYRFGYQKIPWVIMR
jgi:hypothetical protein